MRLARLLFFIGAFFLSLSTVLTDAQAAPEESNAAALSAIEQAVESKREELHVAGAALAIVQNDRVIYLKGLGMRDVEQQRPVTPDTLFAIGSCTKAFTAMTVMMSVDEGKLSLSDPPRKYLPYFKMRDPDTDAKITISDLLCHNSGLTRTDLAWYTGLLRPEEIVRVAGQAKPTAKLGEKWQYQNVMFLAAGLAVGKAQGMPWERFVASRIFGPLGMRSSNLSVPATQASDDFALGYSYDNNTRQWTYLPMRNLPAIAPAGAINSSAREMAQWLRLMLNGGVYEGKRLVSESGFAQLTANHMKMSENAYYGYGWMVRDWNGLKLVEHGGNIDGFSAEVAFLPEKKLGFVMLTNANVSPLGGYALQTIFSKLTGITARPAPSTVAAPAGPAVDPASEAGVYTVDGSKTKITVAMKDGRPMLRVPGQPEFPMENLTGRRYKLGAPAPPGFFATFRPVKDHPDQTELFLEQPQGNIVLKKEQIVAFTAPITVEELMRKALAAAGGEGVLRRHRTLVEQYRGEIPEEGLRVEGTIYHQTPNLSADRFRLFALNKKIAEIREYFDGKRGGAELSFSSASSLSGNELADTAIAADFYGSLLNWKTLFKTVVITGMGKVGDEETYVVVKTPEKGSPITDHYSTRSFLLLKREGPGSASETFSDYRPVDGVMVPFRRTRQGFSGGTAELTITRAGFNTPISATTFLPSGTTTGSRAWEEARGVWR